MNTLRPIENLHYALGQIAYAVACADGEVQKAERQKFFDIVATELRNGDPDFDITSIIFQVLDKDHSPGEDVYCSAMKQIRGNSHYLSPALKISFVTIAEKMAEAFTSANGAESTLVERFKNDIAPIQGDPAYYSKT